MLIKRIDKGVKSVGYSSFKYEKNINKIRPFSDFNISMAFANKIENSLLRYTVDL
jgi:hypothetical protein